MKPKIDWVNFVKSRIARLAPLYLVVVTCVGIVSVISFGLREPIAVFLDHWIPWFYFGLGGAPNFNKLNLAWTMISGVNWTLAYEVKYYLIGVPIIFIVCRYLGQRYAPILFGVTIGMLLLIDYMAPLLPFNEHSQYIIYFAIGGIVAVLTKYDYTLKIVQSKYTRIIAVGCLVALVTVQIPYATIMPYVMKLIIFAAVVGGGSLFGLLKTKAAIWLGDCSYGIYLIHGLTLWTVFNTIGVPILKGLTLWQYWGLTLLLASLITMMSSISYVKLERPFILKSHK